MRIRDEAPGQLDHGIPGILCSARRGHLVARDDVAVDGQDGAEEGIGSRKVDPEDPMACAVKVDDHRGLARARCFTDAELGHEAVADELGHEVGDRDAGEARLARKIGAAHGAVVEQRLQYERAIVGPGVLGKHLDPAKTPALRSRVAARYSIRRTGRLLAGSREGVRGFSGRAALHFRCSHVC